MTIIRIIDFETTGTEPESAEVCQAGYSDYDVEQKSVYDYHEWFCGISTPMPPEVRAIHHISAEDCEGSMPFDADTLDDDKVYAFAAHNSEFETKFFKTPKPIICTYKSALRVWPNAPGHSNGTLRYWLEDQGKIYLDHSMTQPAHRAGPDAYTTAHILKALFADGATGKEMVAWTKEPRLLPTCPIGKFRGKPWSEVENGFLGWMLKQETMEEDLKWNARKEIERRSGGDRT